MALQGGAALLQRLETVGRQHAGEFTDAQRKERGIEPALAVDVGDNVLQAHPRPILFLPTAAEPLLGRIHGRPDARQEIAAQDVRQYLPKLRVRNLSDGRTRHQALQRDRLLDRCQQFAHLLIAQ